MSNRRRPNNPEYGQPQALPSMPLTLTENHRPSDDVCKHKECGKRIYKTARKPWRHYHNRSTFCNHDERGILR